jgi:hypothetical protein
MINVRHLSGLGLSLAAFVLVCACDNPPTAPSGPYTLSGVVTQMTSSGRVPIRGVFVEESNIHRQAVTDDRGRYRLAALPAGVATIQVSMLRFESASRSVTVSGDTTVDVELVQREQFTLSGFVTEETAAGRGPVAGAYVEVVVCPPQPRGGHSIVEVETDISGFYSVSGMCDGTTTLYAWKPGYDLQPASDKPCGNDGEWCRWVTIAGNTRFDFQLSR